MQNKRAVVLDPAFQHVKILPALDMHRVWVPAHEPLLKFLD